MREFGYSPLHLAGRSLAMALTFSAAPLLAGFGTASCSALGRRLRAHFRVLRADIAALWPLPWWGLAAAADSVALTWHSR